MATMERLTRSDDLLVAEVISSSSPCRFAKTFDLVIIGAGPAGTYLAWLLSRQGFNPVIIDHSFPTDKRALDLVPVEYLSKFPVLGALVQKEGADNLLHILSPGGKEAVVINALDPRTAVSVSNPSRYLLHSAISRGARFIPERVTSIRYEKGLWKITTTKHQIRARNLAGADGVKSFVRKALHKPFSRKDLLLVLGYEVSGLPESSYVKFVHGRQGLLKARGSPCNGTVEISDTLINSAGLKKDLDTFLYDLAGDVKILNSWSVLIPRASSSDFFRSPSLGKDWILIGDAAGHVNPLTGDGLIYALWSADIAAQAITAGDMRLYEILWRKEYGDALQKAADSINLFFKRGFIETTIKLAANSPTLSKFLFGILSGSSTPGLMIRNSLIKAPSIFYEMVRKSKPELQWVSHSG